ncbi:MAG: glycosyltransferase family 4 protein [Armatimonadetes bacterium]|nr:glycosyltransferase family 4 protein [Armatimonadota bacterium]
MGADVAVHLTLAKNYPIEECNTTFITNCRAPDAAITIEKLQSFGKVNVIPMRLGYELVNRRDRASRAAGVIGNLFELVKALPELRRRIKRDRIEIIHSTDRPRDALLSTLLAKSSGRPNLIHVHIKWYPEIGRLTDWALQKATGVIAISDFVRDSLIEGGISASKIYRVYNATDPEEYDPVRFQGCHIRRRFGIDESAPLIGIVARIMVWKGHRELIEALALVRNEHPNVKLLVVGLPDTVTSPDSYDQQVKARAKELGIEQSIIWAGWINEMPEVMAGLDILAVPSWEEPFGLVVTEAMAIQKPVVGFRSGALPEIIEDGKEGLLVEPKNVEQLSRGLRELLGDSDRRREMGRLGREKVINHFSPRHQAAAMATIYRRICRQ